MSVRGYPLAINFKSVTWKSLLFNISVPTFQICIHLCQIVTESLEILLKIPIKMAQNLKSYEKVMKNKLDSLWQPKLDYYWLI